MMGAHKRIEEKRDHFAGLGRSEIFIRDSISTPRSISKLQIKNGTRGNEYTESHCSLTIK